MGRDETRRKKYIGMDGCIPGRIWRIFSRNKDDGTNTTSVENNRLPPPSVIEARGSERQRAQAPRGTWVPRSWVARGRTTKAKAVSGRKESQEGGPAPSPPPKKNKTADTRNAHNADVDREGADHEFVDDPEANLKGKATEEKQS